MNHCPDCGRFLPHYIVRCIECEDHREWMQSQRERIDATPIPPYCPYPWGPCICGDPR